MQQPGIGHSMPITRGVSMRCGFAVPGASGLARDVVSVLKCPSLERAAPGDTDLCFSSPWLSVGEKQGANYTLEHSGKTYQPWDSWDVQPQPWETLGILSILGGQNPDSCRELGIKFPRCIKGSLRSCFKMSEDPTTKLVPGDSCDTGTNCVPTSGRVGCL